MQFTLTITCDNDAFQPSAVPEIARILRDTAGVLEEEGEVSALLVDVNGNRVGSFRFASVSPA